MGLRAFQGTAGYYRRFIPEFAKWTGPLFAALKKDAPSFIQWDKCRTNAFNHLVNVLCDEHTPTLPRSEGKLVLHTDASMLGVRAVLSVECEGEEFPVAYLSKILKAAERNYSASEMECLAVVKAVDHFAIHRLGQRFTVVTDHRALVFLQE